MLTARVLLRNNETGEERWYVETFDDHSFIDDGIFEFMWTEGNFACDCNRSLLFARAVGGEEDNERSCSSNVYAAVRAEISDGRVIELDALETQTQREN